MHLSTTPSTVYPCSASGRREQRASYESSPSETHREGGPAFSQDALLLMTREANTMKRDPGGCDLVFITCLDPKHLSILLGDGAGTFRSRAPKHPLPQAATNLPWLCTRPLQRRLEGEHTNLSACGKCYLLPIVDDLKSWNPSAHHTCQCRTELADLTEIKNQRTRLRHLFQSHAESKNLSPSSKRNSRCCPLVRNRRFQPLKMRRETQDRHRL